MRAIFKWFFPWEPPAVKRCKLAFRADVSLSEIAEIISHLCSPVVFDQADWDELDPRLKRHFVGDGG